MSEVNAWANRIVGSGVAAPGDLLANPANWRTHPKAQKLALGVLLDKVGWVQDVVVNRRSGLLVDGHLRVELAKDRREPEIPVVYVDLSPEEEAMVLATFNPLGAWAVSDDKMLAELRFGVSGDEEVRTLFDLMEAKRPQSYAPTGSPSQAEIDARGGQLASAYSDRSRERAAGFIHIDCPNCHQGFAVQRAEIIKEANDL